MTWRKTGPDAVEQHYRYDDEQRIAEVSFSGHKEFSREEYRYDALGRRTHKILHRHHKPEETISFLWSGMRMVGESSSLTPDRNTQYLYSEGSWEPLARVDSIGEQADIFWYHTELNGLPERMTNEEGDVVWRGRFSTWGMTGQESSSGFQSVPQNLRFQGQYLDRD
ncbi:RHS domain-containing protein [Erwinia sp. QL-Z3]|uniref:RHS repeat domain-containing protein n=1 Tax=Erwinia sp. QL-Z3 TaxID=2547962 RepID=UPI00142F5F76